MKKALLMLVSLFLLLGAVSLCAASDDERGEGKGGPGNYEDRAKEMKTKLELTDDQYTKVLAVMKKYDEKMKSASRDDMQTMHEAEEKEVKALLDSDQKTTYENMRQAPPEKRE